MRYLLTILIVFCLILPAYSWEKFDSAEGTAPEEGLWTGQIGTTFAHTGTHGWEFPVTAGVDGGNIGAWTFELGSTLSAGDEVWFRVYFYFPSGFNWQYYNNANFSIVKLMRFYVSQTTPVYISVEENYNGFGDCGSWELGYISGASEGMSGEGFEDLNCQTKNLPYSTLTTETWHSLEMYVKLSSTDTGIVRVWHQGILKIEITDVSTTDSGGTLIFNEQHHLLGWWNGGSQVNQTLYADDWKITDDQATNQDAEGNFMIGPIGWVATTPTITPGITITGATIQ